MNEKRRAQIRAWDKKRLAEMRAIVEERKKTGCSRCGYKEHLVALDLHHVRGKKIFNIGDISRNPMSIRRLLEELSKCDVLCANCHRVVTWG